MGGNERVAYSPLWPFESSFEVNKGVIRIHFEVAQKHDAHLRLPGSGRVVHSCKGSKVFLTKDRQFLS